MKFPNPLEMAHSMVRERLSEGDVAVDATAGNGNDTVFLASLVGDVGKVYAFDVQTDALVATGATLEKVGLLERVQLVEADHAEMAMRIPLEHREKVRAVMFNLGYLPGGNKAVVTRPESTVKAIEAALELIVAGGIVTVVVYTGHSGGAAEAEELESRVSAGLPNGIEGVRYSPLGRKNAPYLLAFRLRLP